MCCLLMYGWLFNEVFFFYMWKNLVWNSFHCHIVVRLKANAKTCHINFIVYTIPNPKNLRDVNSKISLCQFIIIKKEKCLFFKKKHGWLFCGGKIIPQGPINKIFINTLRETGHGLPRFIHKTSRWTSNH